MMKLSSILPPFILKSYSYLSTRIKDERRFNDPNVSLYDKIWLWSNGFSSGHKKIYGLNKENIHLFLDNTSYRILHPINGIYSQLLDNKAFLPFICPFVCEVYVVVIKGKERFRKGLADGDLLQVLADFMKKNENDIICKPIGDALGNGFRVLKINNFKDEIINLINNNQSFIINERVAQDEYSERIFSGSVNTIRFMFYRDVDSHRINIQSAIQRIGTTISQPIDNVWNGGLLVNIDIETGELGKAYVHMDNTFKGMYSSHPDSNEKIEGIFIPEWNKKLKSILDFFESLSWFEYGGPDIVLTKDGFVVLEINSCPLFVRAQMDRPFLADERIKIFFLSKGLKLRK